MRRGGFTLIELAVVFLILAVTTAVAVPAFLDLARENDLTVATRSMDGVLRAARDSAVRSGTTVTVVVDSVTGLAWIDAPAAVHSPTSLGLPEGIRLHLPAARTRFTFAPSGRAFADPVVLEGIGGSRLLTVDRWTGDVVVQDPASPAGLRP